MHAANVAPPNSLPVGGSGFTYSNCGVNNVGPVYASLNPTANVG